MPEISLSMSQILTHSSCFTESEQEPTLARNTQATIRDLTQRLYGTKSEKASSLNKAGAPPHVRAGPAKSEAKWLPVKLVDRTLLMCHQHPPGALVELQQIGKTASSADGVLHDPPEAFDGVEVVPTMGR